MALLEDPRFLFLGDSKSKRCALLLLGHVEDRRTLTLTVRVILELFGKFSQSRFVLLCKAFRINLLFAIMERISIFSGIHL